MVKFFECEVAKKFRFGVVNFFVPGLERNFLGAGMAKEIRGLSEKIF